MERSWSYEGLLSDDLPDIYLHEINREPIGMLKKSAISDFEASMELINISTLSFRYNINRRTPPNYYNDIKNGRCFEVIGYGWFVITSSELVKNEEEYYVDITAESFQTVLQEKKLYNIGTMSTDSSYDLYILYNENDKEHSILHKVIEKNPKWRIGYIDPDIKNAYRTFNVSETSSYELLVVTASEAYECYFIFDFNNRIISAYKAKNIGDDTGIYISYKNALSEYGLKENRSEMATRIDVYGGDDCGNGNLNIINVNPSGSNYLINLDYFKDRIPEPLKSKLENYSTILTNAIPEYSKMTSSLNMLYAQLNNLKSYVSTTPENLSTCGLYQLQQLESAKNVVLSTLTSKASSSEYTTCYNELQNIQNFLRSKELEVNVKQAEIDSTITTLTNYNKMLNMSTNFTLQELYDLEDFMIDGSYTNESYVCTDNMTQAERLSMQMELLESAQEYLKKVAFPTYELTLNSSNFIKVLGEKARTTQFKLGNIISIDLDENLSGKANSFVQLKLLKVTKKYTDTGIDFTFTFCSKLELVGGEIAYEEMLGDITSANKYLSYNASTISRAYDIVNSSSSFLKADFNATLNKLKESDKQQFIIDNTGAKLKKALNENEYSPNQIWMTNNGIYMTTDSFQTIFNAIGEIVTEDNQIIYGIAADILVGRIFIGEKLKLSGSGAELDITTNKAITDINGEIKDVKAEFKFDINGLRSEFNTTIAGYYNKLEITTLFEQTTTNINMSVDSKLTNYSTTEQVKSLISLGADSIKLTVNGSITTLDKAMSSTSATIELKVDKTDGGTMVSAINAVADNIKISGAKIDITGNVTFNSVASTANSASSSASNAYTNANTAQQTIDQYKTALANGTTRINGGCIDTGSLSADFITTAARGTGWNICKHQTDEGANYICGYGRDYNGSSNVVIKTGGNVAFACGMDGYEVGSNTSSYGATIQLFHSGTIKCVSLETPSISATSISTSSLSITGSFSVSTLSATSVYGTNMYQNGYTVLSTGNYTSWLSYAPSGHGHNSTEISVSLTPSGNIDFIGSINAATPDWCNSTFAPLSSSDMRLKYDIRSLDDVKEFYMNLKTKSYRFKDNCAYDKKIHNGVMAQELISNLSNCGIDYADSAFIQEYETRPYMDEGMYTNNGKAYRVNYDEFHAYHIKMIQMLCSEVDELKDEIRILKGGVN